MSKELCEKIIRDIAVNIAATLANQSEKIKEKQEKTLVLRWERSNFDEDTYIASLKSNVLFYKVNIRNREALLMKWIQSGLIPENKKRNEEFEILAKKCKGYVQRGINSQGSTFSDLDKKFFLSYEDIDKNQAKVHLEQEYKNLNLYNEVLSIFINDLSTSSLEEFYNLDSKEILKLIKTDIIKATNYIKKSLDKIEKKLELNSMENKFLQSLNEINEEVLIGKMNKVYKEACEIEEIEYYQGFGLDKETIKDFISSIILLDLVSEKDALLLNGALRLLICGEFGVANYGEFIKYIATNKLDLSKNVYTEGIKIIENRYTTAIENKLSKINVNESKYIDFEEYIYILENTDSSKKYNRKSNNTEDVSNLSDDFEESGMEVSNNNEINDDIKSNNPHKKKKKIAIVCTIICIAVGFGVGGLFIGGALQQDNKDEEPEVYTPMVEEVEEDDKDLEIDEYLIADSDSRYLTEAELAAYTTEELSFIRNEIFARYGYVFNNEKYINYFSEKSWYTPDSSFEGNKEDFNDYEIENINLIKSLESERLSFSDYKDYFYIQEESPDEYYAVYTEAYNYKSEAESYMNTLENKNIKSKIREEDSLYKVQVGDTTDLQIARDICEELEEINVDTYILGYSSDYDIELDAIRELAENGDYEAFMRRYGYLKTELKDKPIFGRYDKLLEELYEEYKSYL